MYQTVLLCYDGSPDGHKALDEGVDIVQRCGATAHLLAIAPIYPTDAEGLTSPELLEADCADFKQMLDEGVASLQAAGIQVVGHLAQGRPIEVIARFAQELNADLIVVGHRHQGRLARWWRGSVGSSLVDLAPCSVLVAVDTSKKKK